MKSLRVCSSEVCLPYPVLSVRDEPLLHEQRMHPEGVCERTSTDSMLKSMLTCKCWSHAWLKEKIDNRTQVDPQINISKLRMVA